MGFRALLLLAMGVFFATGTYAQSLADLARQSRSRAAGQSTEKVLTNEDVSTGPPTPAPPPAAAVTGAARPAGQAAAATGQAAGAGRPGQPATGQAAGQPGQAATGQGPAASGQPATAQPGQAAAGGQPAAGQAAGGAAAEQAAAGQEPAEKTQAELELEYRQKFAELRENLSLEERKLDILQREFNLMQQQYYSDPAATLMQEYTRENLTNRTKEIEQQRAAVEMAKQAIANLEEELRVKGLPPGWAR
jgi:hypothetical protein